MRRTRSDTNETRRGGRTDKEERVAWDVHRGTSVREMA